MKWVVEFIDHNGKTRHAQPFDTKMAAELAQIFIPLDLESKVVPLIEYEVENAEGQDREGVRGICLKSR